MSFYWVQLYVLIHFLTKIDPMGFPWAVDISWFNSVSDSFFFGSVRNSLVVAYSSFGCNLTTGNFFRYRGHSPKKSRGLRSSLQLVGSGSRSPLHFPRPNIPNSFFLVSLFSLFISRFYTPPPQARRDPTAPAMGTFPTPGHVDPTGPTHLLTLSWLISSFWVLKFFK